MTIQSEIEQIKANLLAGILALFGEDKESLLKFQQSQADIQHTINRVQMMVGPKYAPAIIRLYATMLDELNTMAENYKKSLEEKK